MVAAFALLFPLSTTHAQAPQRGVPESGGWRTLTGPELRTLITSRKLGGINSRGEPYLITYNNNGTITGAMHFTGSSDPHAVAMDTGRWEIQGDQVCAQMTAWLRGERNCWQLQTANGAYRRVGPNVLNSHPEVYLDRVPWKGGFFE
jgi:hypothetical protein